MDCLIGPKPIPFHVMNVIAESKYGHWYLKIHENVVTQVSFVA